MKLNWKSIWNWTIPLIMVLGIVFSGVKLGIGFYYKTNDKLDIHETKIKDLEINTIIATESRGFIFGSIIAYALKVGFVPLRKPGKLPWKTIKKEFKTEYSTDCFEIHIDAVKKGDKCLIVDDIIATGGSAKAACDLVEELNGNVVGVLSLTTLTFLGGEEKLKKYPLYTLIREEN